MTSPDGINWTIYSAAELNQWWSITYGNGIFVAVSSDGTNRVMTSPGCVVPSPVIDSFTVNDLPTVEVAAGTDVTLAWETTNADYCEALTPEGVYFNTAGAFDSTGITIQANSTPGLIDTYILLCSLNGGEPVMDTVTVRSEEIAPTLTSVVGSGASAVFARMVPIDSTVNVVWDTKASDPASCTLTGGGLTYTPESQTGSIESGQIQGRTTFTLTCPSGSDTATVDIVPIGAET